MRKNAFAIAAAAIMLLAWAFAAEATMGPGTLGGLDKNYSPIETVACRFNGPTCPGRLHKGMPSVQVLVRPLPVLSRREPQSRKAAQRRPFFVLRA